MIVRKIASIKDSFWNALGTKRKMTIFASQKMSVLKESHDFYLNHVNGRRLKKYFIIMRK